jgi:hypothetical protein
MADEQLKRVHFYGGGVELETTIVNGVHLVRDQDGAWHYADSWIKVPGARDLTLTERFDPKFVISKDGTIERVVVPSASLDEAPELLGWCLQVGTPIKAKDGQLVEILVPIEDWQERERVPGELVAPEYHGTAAERELAQAEREYREADRDLELAADKRAEVLRNHSEDMTRQEARRITGLSVGRIQQLIRSDSLSEGEREILQNLHSQRPKKLKAIQKTAEAAGIHFGTEFLSRRLRELVHRELVVQAASGFKLTKDGREALAEAQAAAEDSDAEVEAG